MGHEIGDAVALGCRVLGVTPDVEVEAGPVFQKDVRRTTPADHPAKEVASHLVWAQSALTPQSERDPVLVLESEDAPIHLATVVLAAADSVDARRELLLVVPRAPAVAAGHGCLIGRLAARAFGRLGGTDPLGRGNRRALPGGP